MGAVIKFSSVASVYKTWAESFIWMAPTHVDAYLGTKSGNEEEEIYSQPFTRYYSRYFSFHATL